MYTKLSKKIFLILLGIGFAVTVHAETRPTLAGLQAQINGAQAQIAQINGSCGCWTQQELLDIVTQIDWFPYTLSGPTGSTIIAQKPFVCTRSYSSRSYGNDFLRDFSAKIEWPGGGSFGTREPGYVSIQISEGGGPTCRKNVNGVVTQLQYPDPNFDQRNAQQCYAQIIAVGQTLPGCNFPPITIP